METIHEKSYIIYEIWRCNSIRRRDQNKQPVTDKKCFHCLFNGARQGNVHLFQDFLKISDDFLKVILWKYHWIGKSLKMKKKKQFIRVILSCDRICKFIVVTPLVNRVSNRSNWLQKVAIVRIFSNPSNFLRYQIDASDSIRSNYKFLYRKFWVNFCGQWTCRVRILWLFIIHRFVQ